LGVEEATVRSYVVSGGFVGMPIVLEAQRVREQRKGLGVWRGAVDVGSAPRSAT